MGDVIWSIQPDKDKLLMLQDRIFYQLDQTDFETVVLKEEAKRIISREVGRLSQRRTEDICKG